VKSVEELIQQYNLQPHPEGGYYASTYQASLRLSKEALPNRFTGDRPVSTAILFLLEQGDFSAFHRIQSDECWHFYEGGPLNLHCISPEGDYRLIELGRNANGHYQYIVPAGDWFAAEPQSHVPYCLVGCTVSPGFHFDELELAEKNQLIEQYPSCQKLIERLCRK
jgi:predicted cupin superfamily sugar epimerase